MNIITASTGLLQSYKHNCTSHCYAHGCTALLVNRNVLNNYHIHNVFGVIFVATQSQNEL